ncbi:biotin/lipoyl-containing protein [Flavilitoribacter nigricans]|uniref:Oxaloacetate decarboxylase n=1 Tax=Flavilitoribacter nigricans (strain ATCC 23147 / DSM 23189 / NBRC 102662 / NCIMB 1420 / SS-2) TaxID=1122177 RepID=A0A2D0NH69_FLAN2|nr:biotin/lipoyl-containing protein [Flavilitoribacter nigricans]PHN07730.1 oxaloacetate decarboxylase [Flavilitoribacter nigricans DSM 23189 = NBRC 102662]
MTKDIKLCLVYRDMWQSSGKYMPRVDQLVRVAEPIVEMGCFARVETNGGGFEQINLLFGENPNVAVRKWTQPFNDAGIQTQMLERGLNALRMSPVPADVRRLMFKVKKLQGTDIARSFDGLNNPQNLALSFRYAKEGGMIAQGALSITHSPVHTVEYYIQLADQYIALGAEEICIKDMAGIGRPVSIGKMIKGIKERHPEVLVQYHGHSTPGFSVASSLEAARNGADIIDVGMEPLSWGTGHADLLTIHAMLKDAGFSLPDINTKAYMQARSLSQEFIDDFLGYYINPQNRFLNSLLIGPGLPGGMMGSLMADLEKNLSSLNRWLEKRNRPPMKQEDLLLKLFEEVEYAWPRLGYPPLVTPFSQYVKNVSLMNAIQLIKGKDRWSMIDENTWNMILGKSGRLPGELGDEILALAKAQDREFYTGNPQDLYPDALDSFAEKMQEKGWDRGQDDEELLEYALHPSQYEAYKSGEAKQRFRKDLEERKAAKSAPEQAPPASAATPAPAAPRQMTIDVDGVKYRVKVAYDEQGAETTADDNSTAATTPPPAESPANHREITAPLEGKFFLTKDSGEKAVKVGDQVREGDTIAYIESMKVINAVTADKSGKVVEVVAQHGTDIEEDDVIFRIS